MRAKLTLCLIAGVCAMFCALGTSASSNKPPPSLESIFSGSEFQNATLDNIQWRGNGSSFTFTRRNAETGLLDMYEHNVKSGKNKLLISSMELVYKDQLFLSCNSPPAH